MPVKIYKVIPPPVPVPPPTYSLTGLSERQLEYLRKMVMAKEADLLSDEGDFFRRLRALLSVHPAQHPDLEKK